MVSISTIHTRFPGSTSKDRTENVKALQDALYPPNGGLNQESLAQVQKALGGWYYSNQRLSDRFLKL